MAPERSTGDGNGAAARLKSLGRAAIYAGFAYLTLKVISGTQGSQSRQQQDVTAKVMQHPGGRWLVGIVGLIIVLIGLVLISEGIRRKFMKYLRTSQLSPTTKRVVTWLGVIGTVARGVVFGLVAVVAHARKSFGGGLSELRQVLTQEGVTDPLWYEVRKSRKAPKYERRAAAEGAGLILVWGGDGTVQRCIDALAGTDAVIAILPAGTANLLATNLGVPSDDVRAAVHVGLHGDRRVIDTGSVNGEHFAVMAGARRAREPRVLRALADRHLPADQAERGQQPIREPT